MLRYWMFRSTRSAAACGVLALTALVAPVVAQQAPADGPTAAATNLRPLSEVDKTVIPALNLLEVQQQDEADFLAGLAPRYAVPHAVNLTPQNSGTWEKLEGNESVWRLQVESPNALHINLGFTRYFMPVSGRLYLYNPDITHVIRPFTADDNAPHGELWTPPTPGETLVIEVTIADGQINNLVLELGMINVGYRKFGPYDGGGGVDSGSCNVDVVCPQGAAWADEIPCVGVISTGGSRFCTGFLVNNTAQDFKPYFMTANHCGITGGNAASLVVFWHYQNSFCRTPGSAPSGQPGNGSLATFSTGSTWRASSAATDFTLVELTSQPNPAWNLSWAGWNRNNSASGPGVCIHHPSTDEKRITFYNTLDTNNCGFGGSHWRAFWTLGVTEPGSSGSPLFDVNHRVIGQLHGGPSACGVPAGSLNDCYGAFWASWTGNGTNSSRLSNWLDPLNTGVTTLNTLLNSQAIWVDFSYVGLVSNGEFETPYKTLQDALAAADPGALIRIKAGTSEELFRDGINQKVDIESSGGEVLIGEE